MRWLRGDMRGFDSLCKLSDRGIDICLGVLGIRSWLSAACLLSSGCLRNFAEASFFFLFACEEPKWEGWRTKRSLCSSNG